MHRIIERQIKRIFGENFVIPLEWKLFLELVSETYLHFDEDRELLNRSLDISSREFFEKNETLKKTLENYQSLVNNLSIGVYRNTPGPKGRFLEVNPAIVSLFEAGSKEELLKHNVSDLYRDPAKRSLFVEKIMKNGSVKNEELELVSLKGKKLICSVTAVMKKNKDGMIYFDGLIEDITDRKKMIEAIKKTRDELEIRVKERTKELEDTKKAIVNVLEDLNVEKINAEKAKVKVEAILTNIADGVIVVDKQGGVILINQAAEKMLGWLNKEALNKLWFEVLLREDENGNMIPPEKGAIKFVLEGGLATSSSSLSYYYVRKDGSRFPIVRTVSPLIIEGEIIGAIVVFRDVTSFKEIDRAKTEFISITSHELRAPLGIMKAFISMIFDGDFGQFDKKLEEPLVEIRESNERLIRLVNEMLNVSRVESNRLIFSLSNFRVDNLINTTIKGFENSLINKEVKIKTEILTNDEIQADTDKTCEILENLIENAIKFTNRGEITVRAKTMGDFVNISVSDTGIGIAREDQNKLFSKFKQITSKEQGKPTGTGLGLYFSHALATKMGGGLWLESSIPDEGSTFVFSLPKSNSQTALQVKQQIEKESKSSSFQKDAI